MTTTADRVVSPSPIAAETWALRALWFLVVVFAARFIVTASLDYVDYRPEVYGRWWSHRLWLAGHVVGGTLALAIGPVQFVAAIRRRHLALHRALGHVYVVAITLGSVCATVLGCTTAMAVHWTWGVALLGLALAWFTTVAMGFRAIRLARRTQHREWMIRSYVVTYAFVVFRILNRDLFPVPEDQPQVFLSQGPTFAWVSWAVPLLLTEACLQWRKR